MSLALASCIALLVAALNLTTESAILRHAQKDWPTLGDKFKHVGIVLVILAVAFFGAGCWFHFFPNKYVYSNLCLSLALTLVIPGVLIAIKGKRLKENQPEKLGRQLHRGAIVMAIIAVVLLVWTLIRLLINF